MRRVFPVLLAALALGGCGTAATSAPPVGPLGVTAQKPRHVHVLPKKVFTRRANRICAELERTDIGSPPAVTGDVGRNRQTFGAWFGHVHTVVRRARRHLVRLGRPSRDRARWTRVMSKLTAIESHLDTMRASAWSGSVDMLVLSARELKTSARSLDRRFRRFGATRCAD